MKNLQGNRSEQWPVQCAPGSAVRQTGGGFFSPSVFAKVVPRFRLNAPQRSGKAQKSSAHQTLVTRPCGQGKDIVGTTDDLAACSQDAAPLSPFDIDHHNA